MEKSGIAFQYFWCLMLQLKLDGDAFKQISGEKHRAKKRKNNDPAFFLQGLLFYSLGKKKICFSRYIIAEPLEQLWQGETPSEQEKTFSRPHSISSRYAGSTQICGGWDRKRRGGREREEESKAKKLTDTSALKSVSVRINGPVQPQPSVSVNKYRFPEQPFGLKQADSRPRE